MDAHTHTNKYNKTYRWISTDLSEGGFLKREQHLIKENRRNE